MKDRPIRALLEHGREPPGNRGDGQASDPSPGPGGDEGERPTGGEDQHFAGPPGEGRPTAGERPCRGDGNPAEDGQHPAGVPDDERDGEHGDPRGEVVREHHRLEEGPAEEGGPKSEQQRGGPWAASDDPRGDWTEQQGEDSGRPRRGLSEEDQRRVVAERDVRRNHGSKQRLGRIGPIDAEHEPGEERRQRQ